MSDNTFSCGHTMDNIVGGVCAGCMADDGEMLERLHGALQRVHAIASVRWAEGGSEYFGDIATIALEALEAFDALEARR